MVLDWPHEAVSSVIDCSGTDDTKRVFLPIKLCSFVGVDIFEAHHLL